MSKHILVVSDTHRKDGNLFDVIDKEKNVDMLIHLGDLEGSEEIIESVTDYPCIMIAGNNDYFSALDREKIIDIEGRRCFLTHGHNYSVSLGYERILMEAYDLGADVVMFGHTHRPVVEEEDGILLINPGSLSYPRQDNGYPSYIIMDVDEDGEIHCTIKYLQ